LEAARITTLIHFILAQVCIQCRVPKTGFYWFIDKKMAIFKSSYVPFCCFAAYSGGR